MHADSCMEMPFGLMGLDISKMDFDGSYHWYVPPTLVHWLMVYHLLVVAFPSLWHLW